MEGEMRYQAYVPPVGEPITIRFGEGIEIAVHPYHYRRPSPHEVAIEALPVEPPRGMDGTVGIGIWTQSIEQADAIERVVKPQAVVLERTAPED